MATKRKLAPIENYEKFTRFPYTSVLNRQSSPLDKRMLEVVCQRFEFDTTGLVPFRRLIQLALYHKKTFIPSLRYATIEKIDFSNEGHILQLLDFLELLDTNMPLAKEIANILEIKVDIFGITLLDKNDANLLKWLETPGAHNLKNLRKKNVILMEDLIFGIDKIRALKQEPMDLPDDRLSESENENMTATDTSDDEDDISDSE